MNMPLLLKYAVHVTLEGQERELHLESNQMKIGTSGTLEFYRFNQEGELALHFCLAAGVWKGCWQLTEEKNPIGVLTYDVVSPTPESKLKEDPTVTKSVNVFDAQKSAQAAKKEGSTPGVVNKEPFGQSGEPAFSVMPVGSFKGAKGSFGSKMGSVAVDKKDSGAVLPQEKKEEGTLQILTPEQRIAQYLGHHQYLGLSSLSATLDIPVEVLERHLWQLCKDKKIPMSYLSLPTHQEELQKYLPQIMAQDPKNIGAIMAALESQELSVELESFQVHIWLHNYKKQKKDRGQPYSEAVDSKDLVDSDDSTFGA